MINRAIGRLEALLEQGAIEPTSKELAEKVLFELSRNRIKPRRVAKTADRQVAIWVIIDEFKARIEVWDDGNFVLSIHSIKPECHLELDSIDGVIANLISAINDSRNEE